MNNFRLKLALYILLSLALVGATILLAIVFEAPWALFIAFGVVMGVGCWLDWEIGVEIGKHKKEN